jgi:hypothetical protein
MKSGFTYQGAEIVFNAGSFGRVEGSAQAGVKSGNWGAYFGGERIEDNGGQADIFTRRGRDRRQQPVLLPGRFQLNPQLGGYWRVDLDTSYDVTPRVQIFGIVNNLFDSHYGVFGTFFNLEAGNSAAAADPALGDESADDHAGGTGRRVWRGEGEVLVAPVDETRCGNLVAEEDKKLSGQKTAVILDPRCRARARLRGSPRQVRNRRFVRITQSRPVPQNGPGAAMLRAQWQAYCQVFPGLLARLTPRPLYTFPWQL